MQSATGEVQPAIAGDYLYVADLTVIRRFDRRTGAPRGEFAIPGATFLNDVVAAEDTPTSKPAPDPYLRAVALLSDAVVGPLAPGDCVAVEDSNWGLESARAAGLRTVAVAHTYNAASLGPADLVIPSLSAFDLRDLHRLFLE